MITKNISTEHGNVTSTAEISHTEGGQVIIRVTSLLGDAKHQHSVTVGASDGQDVVASLTAAELQASLQSHLDNVRNDAASVLCGRATVAKVAALLQ